MDDTMPQLRGDLWVWPDGKTLPRVRGAEGEGSGGEGEGGEGGEGGDGGEGGEGQLEVPDFAKALPPEIGQAVAKALQAASGEAASHRNRAKQEERARKALEAKVREFESQGLSELEKRDNRIKELEESYGTATQELRTLRLATQIRDAATAARFADPSDAVAILAQRKDLSVDDETGAIEGLDDLIAELARKKPHLLRGAGNAGGGEGGEPPPADMNAIMRSGLSRVRSA